MGRKPCRLDPPATYIEYRSSPGDHHGAPTPVSGCKPIRRPHLDAMPPAYARMLPVPMYDECAEASLIGMDARGGANDLGRAGLAWGLYQCLPRLVAAVLVTRANVCFGCGPRSTPQPETQRKRKPSLAIGSVGTSCFHVNYFKLASPTQNTRTPETEFHI